MATQVARSGASLSEIIKLADPNPTPVWYKNLGPMFYGSRVMANFVKYPNFPYHGNKNWSETTVADEATSRGNVSIIILC